MSRTRVLAAALALSLALPSIAEAGAVQRPQDKVQRLRVTHELVVDPTATVTMPGATTSGTSTFEDVAVSDDCAIADDLSALDIDIGASGAAGTLDIFPSTAAKGKLAVAVTDQTGNTTVALNINAMGQATTLNVADPGASSSYLVQSAAAAMLQATGTEINNACDISAQLQAITAAGAVTVDGTRRRATLSGGAYAITLAVPGAAAIGAILVIEYTGGDTDAVTLALTNVIGESGGTTATFDADGEGLVLVGTALGWVVLSEFGGVTLA